MPTAIQEIEEKALKLSSHDRAILAEHLIQSLEVQEDDPDSERLWIEEAERRYKEYKEGKVKARPADIVFKDVYSKMK